MNTPTLEIVPATLVSVKALARLKIEQDYLVRDTAAGKAFVESWIKSGITCSLDPSAFAQRVIPFLYWGRHDKKEIGLVRVPTEIAIGSSVKYFPESVEADDVAGLIGKYRDRSDSNRNKDQAGGNYVPQLGIYIAHEGKNRVAFMRHHAEPYFLAYVHELPYPDASRLKIVHSSLPQSQLNYCVLDGRYLQLLSPAPYSPIELLKGYGVEEVSWRELDAPTEQFVFNAIVESGLLWRIPDNNTEAARTFDLVKLAADELAQIQAQTKKQNRSIMDRFVDWIHRVTS